MVFARKYIDSPFSKGDILKVIHNGKTYFGKYIEIDKHGRIKAIGNGVKLSFFPNEYTKATPEEEREFNESQILRKKNQMKREIKRIRHLVSSGYVGKDHLESLIRNYEKEFGEKYEG